MSDMQYSLEIFFTHTSLMVSVNALLLEGCFSATKSFILDHKFSIGFKSGLLPGQSKVTTLFSPRNFFTILERWHGAPSCIKIEVLWTDICNKSLVLSKSTYLDPFMVVPGVKKYNPAVPFLVMAPHIMWLGGCFMVAEVYFSSNHFPTGLRTCLCRTTNCWKVDSSLNKTLPQSSAVQ